VDETVALIESVNKAQVERLADGIFQHGGTALTALGPIDKEEL
jgi:hypothetical protein